MASFLLYKGPSQLNPDVTIVVIATVDSGNRKTGQMVQTFILVEDAPPLAVVKERRDGAICGGCYHRGNPAKGRKRTCYVNLGHGPRVVWNLYHNGKLPDYTSDPEAIANLGADQKVRLGSYGDPAAVPISLWETLLSKAAGSTGYTHQWKAKAFSGFRGLVMASCDTAEEREIARSSGWGTFTVTPVGGSVDGASLCPASIEAGKVTQCQACMRCDGASSADVFIPLHGPSRKRKVVAT